MAAAIRLRDDFTGDGLRRLARRCRNAKQVRRLLALVVIYGGGSRTEAALTGGVGLQIVRDWVVRFNAEGPQGLIDRKAPGKTAALNAEHCGALARAVEAGPRPYIDGVVRWRIKDLVHWVHEEFGISMSEAAMSRTLKRLGFVKLTARPRHHGQDAEALEDFKKTSRYIWKKSGKTSERIRT